MWGWALLFRLLYCFAAYRSFTSHVKQLSSPPRNITFIQTINISMFEKFLPACGADAASRVKRNIELILTGIHWIKTFLFTYFLGRFRHKNPWYLINETKKNFSGRKVKGKTTQLFLNFDVASLNCAKLLSRCLDTLSVNFLFAYINVWQVAWEKLANSTR